jgi:hypothetical protein
MRAAFIHNRLKLSYEMHNLLWLGVSKKACRHLFIKPLDVSAGCAEGFMV